MLRRLAAHLPVRAARFRVAAEQLRKCEARVVELKASLEQARTESRESKAEAAQHAKQIERMQAQSAKTDEQSARERDRLQARLAELTEKRARNVADLRAHLAATERDLALAREHLMTIDVKLDILEGAANALDGRTRAILGRGQVEK